MRTLRLSFVFLCTLVCAGCASGGSFSFADIQNWTGTGANSAALVIDWNGSSDTDQSLVWGYHWSGSATGWDMILAVAQADPRLFLCHSSSGTMGRVIYGIGCDKNNNGVFGVRDAYGNTVTFPESGVAQLSGDPEDDDAAAFATDSGDLYCEGWSNGCWTYARGSGGSSGLTSWTRSATGVSSRALSNGAWDGWTFSPTQANVSPANMMAAAAVPEPSTWILFLGLLLLMPRRAMSGSAWRKTPVCRPPVGRPDNIAFLRRNRPDRPMTVSSLSSTTTITLHPFSTRNLPL